MRLGILGSTGSIGTNVLEVIRNQPRFKVQSLSAHSQINKLCEQARTHKPMRLVVGTAADAEQISNRLGTECPAEVLYGREGLKQVAEDDDTDWIVNALAGTNGLMPTFHALEKGKRVLLANKESLVSAGPLLMQIARRNRTLILPIDSEHNAILRCLPKDYEIGEDVSAYGVRALWLTASGGPFLTESVGKLAHASPKEACAHPTWAMGAKISVDSATLMNKGLELIEAQILFGIKSDRINIIIHPQSIIHCLVEYCDGSFVAQLSRPDMKLAIHQALHYPHYEDFSFNRLTPLDMKTLSFASPDVKKFPCLGLAQQAARTQGALPIVLNAANNIAVQAFLSHQLSFPAIASLVAAAMKYFAPRAAPRTIDEILNLEQESAAYAQQQIRQ